MARFLDCDEDGNPLEPLPYGLFTVDGHIWFDGMDEETRRAFARQLKADAVTRQRLAEGKLAVVYDDRGPGMTRNSLYVHTEKCDCRNCLNNRWEESILALGWRPASDD